LRLTLDSIFLQGQGIRKLQLKLQLFSLMKEVVEPERSQQILIYKLALELSPEAFGAYVVVSS
jgi:hypothetical protein